MKRKPLPTKTERKLQKTVGTPRHFVSAEPSREAIELREKASGFTILIFRPAIRRLQMQGRLNEFYQRMDELKLERRNNREFPEVALEVTGFDYYLLCKFAEEFKLKEQKVHDVVQ